MLVNAGIFLGLLIVAIFLLLFIQKLYDKSDVNKCRFKITAPRYKKVKNKRTARFSISIIGDKTAFFTDFPLVFRFFSDTRFKTRVKVKYSNGTCKEWEEILNRIVIFEQSGKEFICPITDIIPDEIHIELEIDPIYGYPNATFEIRANDLCDMSSELTKEINFPK